MTHERARAAETTPSGPPMLRMDRRTFLELASASVLATSAAGALARTAVAQSPAPTAAVPDAIADLAASLGHDTERIFRWVQEEIRYEPYPGILRGARGTLLARAGNSADQAVLLADLLKASSVPVRYVSGPLTPAASDALMAATVVDTATARHGIEQAVLSEADLAAGIHPDLPSAADPSDAGIAPDVLAQILQGAEDDSQAMPSVAQGQLEGTIAELLAALTSASVTLPSSVSSMPDQERSRHVWVQADPGAGWIDMDPSIPSGVPGDTIGEVDTTLDVLGTDLRHRVDFSVLAESFVGGGLTQQAILQWDAFADELVHRGVVLAFVRPTAAPDVNFLGAGLSDATTYVPALFVGDSALLSPTAISIGTGGGGGGGLFGGALGGGGGEGLVDGETTAVWLEVRVTVPGAKPRVARRRIFDRIGQAMRDSGAVDPSVILPAELVDLGPGQEAEYLPCGTVYAFSVSSGTMNLTALIEGVDYRMPGIGSLLAAGVQGTRDRLRTELVDTIGCMPFDDAPTVVAWVVTPVLGGSERGLDILHRSFGTVALSDRTPGAPPALAAGVLGLVAERVVSGDGMPSGAAGGDPPTSVGSLFQVALDQGIPLRTLMGDVPQDIPLDADPAALIRAALEEGSIVVVPERAVDVGGSPRLGWWIIDPLTGQAVDQLDTGAGSTTEDTIIQAFNAAESSAARSMAQLNAQQLRNIVRAIVTDPYVGIRGLRIFHRVLRLSIRYALP